MAEQGRIVIHYRGGEAEQGQIGYHTAGTALIAFGDLMGLLSLVTYGSASTVETKLRRIGPGESVELDFIVTVGALTQVTQALLAGPATPSQLWDLFKESVKAWKFLRGQPPLKTERVGDSYSMTKYPWRCWRVPSARYVRD